MDELISRQAALRTDCFGDGHDGLRAFHVYEDYKKMRDYIEALPSVQPEPRWIPVKTRPMDDEERAYWSEHLGYDIEYEYAVMFDCPMPEDGQEILVSYRKWIGMYKCEIDGGCYGLEGNGDWEDVIAWMPLPEPYREETEDDA